MDPSILLDPNLTIRLAKQLQGKVGPLPIVETFSFHLESQPGEIVRMLRVYPQSYAEIARVVRAARTMNLTVRGCGDRSGGDIGIYGDGATVLVDCTMLTDCPRIDFVTIHRKGEKTPTPGIRVLACVGIDELVAFQVNHDIEVAQSVDTTSRWGTVVGAITSVTPGVVGPNGGARGGCLSDEVICMRVIDCHGDLIKYTSDEDISAAISTLGVLGVVYDVMLRYRPITLTKVNMKFLTWSNLLEDCAPRVRTSIERDQFTELIYLPYNSCPVGTDGSALLCEWKPEHDEVILHTGRRLSSGEAIAAHQYDSEPRVVIHPLDSELAPDPCELIERPDETPVLLKKAHACMKNRFHPMPEFAQYTPWAINATGKTRMPIRNLRFTIETDRRLIRFLEAMRIIFDMIEDLAKGGAHAVSNFAVNLCIRIQFTGATGTGRLLGVGFQPTSTGVEFDPMSDYKVLAHVTFTGITQPGPNTMWVLAASRITKTMLTQVPQCVPQWKSEWHNIEIIKKKFRESLADKLEPMKALAIIADRNGIFLSDLMASILYPELTFHQALYRSQRTNRLNEY